MTKLKRSSLKSLFLSKIDSIAYGIFALFFIAIFLFYFHNLTNFALTNKIFTIAESGYFPALLLSEKYNGTEGQLFLLALLFIEIFVIWKLLRFGKKISKRTLFTYAIIMQGIAIASLVIIALTPQFVLLNLQQKANKEITSSINILNNSQEIEKRGVLNSIEKIKEKIHMSSFENFQIRESSPQKSALISFLSPSTGKETFYRAIVIPYAVKNNLSIYDLKFRILLFPNNTLVVNAFSKTDLETLLPVISQKILRSEFGTFIHGNVPKTSFLNEEEYVIHQKQREEKIKKDHEEYIVYLDEYIKDTDRIVGVNQNVIDSYPAAQQKAQKAYEEYVAKWGGWYEKCKEERGDDPICEEGKATYEETVKDMEENKKRIDENKKKAEENIQLSIRYKKSSIERLAKAKQVYQEILKNPITPELQEGVFNSPDNVSIRYDDKEEKSFTHYANILLHEYLHYYSFNPSFHMEPFLDEGLTEYLKIDVIKKHIEPELVTRSYADEVAIVTELMKHVQREKIISFYFGQDTSGLQKEFAEKYGPSAYQNFLMKGKELFYSSRDDTNVREQYVKEITTLLTE